MASLWRRAMVYLGLQDDDEFAYDDEYEYPDGHDADVESRELRESPERREPGGRPHREARPEPGLPLRPAARDRSVDVAPQRPSVIRTVATASTRVHVLEPSGFNDAQEIGDRLKAGQPVCIDLREAPRELQRRLIDFTSGLAYATGGHMERRPISRDPVFLVRPSNVEVSEEEKERLRARGLWS
jgi:cell division inhibitor SepF